MIATIPLTPADSARAAAQVYTISLAAGAPLGVAGIAALLVRRRAAGTRALVWRGAVVALLVVFLGHLLPIHWMAWIVPGALASPLVVLGRLQVATAPVPPMAGSPARLFGDAGHLRALLPLYVVGVVAVVWPLARGWLRVRALRSSARPPRDARVAALGEELRQMLGVRYRVRLLVHPEVLGPAACGVVHPAVLLPAAAESWSVDQLRPVLLHELAHVGARDVAFAIAARLTCALYWWHPAVWWVQRRLHDECELACDDRVLAAGVRASAYAELLARAAELAAPGTISWVSPAVALAPRRGLRRRLAAIVDTRRDLRPPGVAVTTLACMLTLAVAAPASVVELAPTRAVLSGLMTDARWDARAYAVLGLAQRADSLAIARAAAVADPSPRVRAWARLALAGRTGGAMARPIPSTH